MQSMFGRKTSVAKKKYRWIRKKSDRDLPHLRQIFEMFDLEELFKQAAKVLSEDSALLKKYRSTCVIDSADKS